MSINLSNPEPDKFAYDNEWFNLHREPTLFDPPDLAAERQEIARLSSSVERLQNAEPGLLKDHRLAIARRFWELCRWRLFPISSFPDDVILHIFRLGTFFSPDNKSAPTMPLIYSSVCKRWRDLALEASWLWGFLAFADDSPYALTKLFIERSKSAPLLIKIDLTDRRFDYEDIMFWPTTQDMVHRLSILLPHIHRWKIFDCYTDNWAPLFGALSTLQHKAAPILRRIEFRQNFDALPIEVLPTRTPFILLGGGAPALRTFALYAIPIDWHNRSFNNLTELSLTRLSTDELPPVQAFLEILHQSPNLQKLALVAAGPQWDEETARSMPAVKLLCLEELEIAGTESGSDLLGYPLNYAIFVMEMFIPGDALHTFDIGGFPEGDHQRALPLIRSHFSQVKRLLLANMPFDVTTAAQWLSAMPHVSYLAVSGSHTEASILDALTCSAAEVVLLPSLSTLSIYSPEVEAVRNVVHTRLAIGVPIKELVFDINLPDIPQAFSSLQEVVDFWVEGELYDSEDEWIGPDPSEWPMFRNSSLQE